MDFGLGNATFYGDIQYGEPVGNFASFSLSPTHTRLASGGGGGGTVTTGYTFSVAVPVLVPASFPRVQAAPPPAVKYNIKQYSVTVPSSGVIAIPPGESPSIWWASQNQVTFGLTSESPVTQGSSNYGALYTELEMVNEPLVVYTITQYRNAEFSKIVQNTASYLQSNVPSDCVHPPVQAIVEALRASSANGYTLAVLNPKLMGLSSQMYYASRVETDVKPASVVGFDTQGRPITSPGYFLWPNWNPAGMVDANGSPLWFNKTAIQLAGAGQIMGIDANSNLFYSPSGAPLPGSSAPYSSTFTQVGSGAVAVQFVASIGTNLFSQGGFVVALSNGDMQFGVTGNALATIGAAPFTPMSMTYNDAAVFITGASGQSAYSYDLVHWTLTTAQTGAKDLPFSWGGVAS